MDHHSTIHHHTQQHHFGRTEHPCHTAFHLIHFPPNDCLLLLSTILEHFGSQVHQHFIYRASIESSSIISLLKYEITQFHHATLTKQQIVRIDVLFFSNTSITYSVNHTSLVKKRQAQQTTKHHLPQFVLIQSIFLL